MLSRWFRCGLLTKKTNHVINRLGPWDSPTSNLQGEVVGAECWIQSWGRWFHQPGLQMETPVKAGPQSSKAPSGFRRGDGSIPQGKHTGALCLGPTQTSPVYLFGWSWSVSSIIVVGVLVTLSCPTLCDPMDCGPPGSFVHGILQARTLEQVAIPFSRGSFQPRDWTWVSCVASRFFTIWATREARIFYNKTVILSIVLSWVLRAILANCQT